MREGRVRYTPVTRRSRGEARGGVPRMAAPRRAPAAPREGRALRGRAVATAQAVTREQPVQVHAVDAGRPRGGADVAAVLGEQGREVGALEGRGPVVARLLERTRQIDRWLGERAGRLAGGGGRLGLPGAHRERAV